MNKQKTKKTKTKSKNTGGEKRTYITFFCLSDKKTVIMILIKEV